MESSCAGPARSLSVLYRLRLRASAPRVHEVARLSRASGTAGVACEPLRSGRSRDQSRRHGIMKFLPRKSSAVSLEVSAVVIDGALRRLSRGCRTRSFPWSARARTLTCRRRSTSVVELRLPDNLLMFFRATASNRFASWTLSAWPAWRVPIGSPDLDRPAACSNFSLAWSSAGHRSSRPYPLSRCTARASGLLFGQPSRPCILVDLTLLSRGPAAPALWNETTD